MDCQYQLLAKLQYVVLSGSVTGFTTVYGIANFNSHGSLTWECFIVSHVLYMFSLGMQLWICHAVVIEPVSVVTKLKVEIHRNIVLHVV